MIQSIVHAAKTARQNVPMLYEIEIVIIYLKSGMGYERSESRNAVAMP